MEYNVNLIANIETAWVKLKMSVVSPGLNYTEIAKLDVFEFFTLLQEVQRKNKAKQ